MTFFKKCYFNICRIRFSLVLPVTGILLLISLICGSMVFYRKEFLAVVLPPFCLPLFFISLLILFSHFLISILLCETFFDNFKCKINRLYSICLLIIYILSIIYVNLFFRFCFVVLSLLVCALILLLWIYLIIKSHRDFLFLILCLLNILIYAYLLAVTLFTLF